MSVWIKTEASEPNADGSVEFYPSQGVSMRAVCWVTSGTKPGMQANKTAIVAAFAPCIMTGCWWSGEKGFPEDWPFDEAVMPLRTQNGMTITFMPDAGEELIPVWVQIFSPGDEQIIKSPMQIARAGAPGKLWVRAMYYKRETDNPPPSPYTPGNEKKAPDVSPVKVSEVKGGSGGSSGLIIGGIVGIAAIATLATLKK